MLPRLCKGLTEVLFVLEQVSPDGSGRNGRGANLTPNLGGYLPGSSSLRQMSGGTSPHLQQVKVIPTC